MKYNQPYGISDPNAPYINGNPSTGTMGSIPPAASIEHPQREIVNFINDTGGITPSEADLHQLAHAVQAGGVNYGDDVGTPNQLVVNLNPPPPALRKGLHVFTIIAHNNYVGGPATLNLNSLGPKPIEHLDHTELTENELKAGTLALFCYDGAKWQWVSAPFVNVVTGALTANRDYYVNPATGSDDNDGLTAATPFQHIQYAVHQSIVVNLNGYNITIHCANGTYVENVTLYPLSGNGMVFITGNPANPALCTINPVNGYCFGWGSIFPTSGYHIAGFKLTSMVDGPPPNGYQGMGVFGGYGAIRFGPMEFGPCRYVHLSVQSSCKITIGQGGGAADFWRISGGADLAHMVFAGGSELLNYQPNLIITGTPSFAYFVEATQLAMVGMRWTSISGAATGRRFYVDLNSIIQTGGMGVNYLPGNDAGVILTGGQYA